MAQKGQRLSYFSVMLYHLTGERAYRGSADSPAGFLKLTTTGRKSGKQRNVHLIYIRDGSAYVVTASNGGKQSCNDDPITNPGNEKPGTVRSWGPDTTWYIAGANSAPIDPNNPYKTDIPGSTYRIKPGWNWYYSTFTVDQDTLDQNAEYNWGSPYPGGAPVAMADGSVRVLNYNINYTVLIPLVTLVAIHVVRQLLSGAWRVPLPPPAHVVALEVRP